MKKISNKYLTLIMSLLICVFAGFFMLLPSNFNVKNSDENIYNLQKSNTQNINNEHQFYEIKNEDVLNLQKVSIKAENINYQNAPSVLNSYFCLRDEYAFVVENQSAFGLCWDFSALSSLENTLSIQTGVLYDFSEAWIALCAKVENLTNVLGNGGNFTVFHDVVKKYGLMLEEQFPYEMLFYIDDSNYMEIYNYYKQFASKYYFENVDIVSFSSNNLQRNTELNNIKKHLINYGAVSVGVDWNCFEEIGGVGYVCSNTSRNVSGHALTIVGWDDTLSYTDKFNTPHTGAFIAVNSWGANENEIIYVAYDDILLIDNCFGCKVNTAKQKTFDVKLETGNSYFENYEKNQFAFNKGVKETTYFKEKNLYFYGDDINLTYNYFLDNKYNNYRVSVDILNDFVSVKNNFDLTLNSSLNKVSLNNKLSVNVDSGTYILKFLVDLQNDGKYDFNYFTQIYVYSGSEFSNVNGGASDADLMNFQSFNETKSTNNVNKIYGYTYDNSCIYSFYLGSFSKVVGYTASYNVLEHSETNFIPCDKNNYAKGKIVLQINSIISYGVKTTNITFILLDDTEIKFEIITYKLSSQDKKAYVFNLDYLSKNDNPNFVAVGSHYGNKTLILPIKDDNYFMGYYKDKNFINSLKNADNYILKNTDFKDSRCTNYAYYERLITYSIVYSKWILKSDVNLIFDDYKITKEFYYANNLDEIVNKCSGGSGDYTYNVVSKNLPSGVSFNLVTLNLQGQALEVGSFNIKLKVVDNILFKEKTATISFDILKRKIEYKIDNKSSVRTKNLKTLTGKLVKGEVYGSDNLNIKYHCVDANGFNITSFSPLGKYDITGTYNNKNYDVKFIKGVYNITTSNISATISSYSGEYDGKYHTVKINFPFEIEDVKINYSLTNSNYKAEKVEFKDFTNGKKTVYVEIVAGDYDTQYLSSTVEVLPRQITVEWTKTNFVYTGDELFPEYNLQNKLNNEDITIIKTGKKINAGENYNATITTENKNYVLNNNTTTFKIDKAIKKLEPVEIKIEIDKTKNISCLKDILLPDGYEWLNPDEKLKNGTYYYLAKYTPSDLENYKVINEVKIKVQFGTNTLSVGFIIFLSLFLFVFATYIVVEIIYKIKKRKLKNLNN